MQQLTSLDVTEAWEVGPGRVLAGLLRRIQREIKTKAVDSADDIRALKG
jgi:[acyl-carrier-protein] S-malonyltransferase